MRWLLGILVAVGLVMSSHPAVASPPDSIVQEETWRRTMFEGTAPSVVLISRKGAFGSGFFVSRDGLVLTNAHVVGSEQTVSVVMHDGRKLEGKVIERAKGNRDLALVKVANLRSTPVPLGRSDQLFVGAFAAAIGHGEGAIWTFNTGIVSNIWPVGAARPVFQTQIPLNPGNSGGPVLDSSGRAVGVVTAAITRANAINFAIKIEMAIAELPTLAAHCDCLTIDTPAGVAVFVNGVMRGVGPRLVIPVRAGDHEVMAVIEGKRKRQSVTFPSVRSVKLR